MSDAEKSKTRDLKFGEAMEELETILGRIESEEIDIDSLAEELRRATALLELARGKIRKAEVEVTQIVQSLEDEGDGRGVVEEEDGGEDEEDVPF